MRPRITGRENFGAAEDRQMVASNKENLQGESSKKRKIEGVIKEFGSNMKLQLAQGMNVTDQLQGQRQILMVKLLHTHNRILDVVQGEQEISKMKLSRKTE